MTIEEAFKHLCKNWEDQKKPYIKKYKTYKSRYLNKSGKQVKKVSQDKKIEMLKAAGYAVDIKIKVTLPNKK